MEMEREKSKRRKPVEQWLPTDVQTLSTSQLARVITCLLQRVDLQCQHRMENGNIYFRVVHRGELGEPMDDE